MWKVGKTWFACLKANRPEAEVARKALARRGYNAAPARHGKAVGSSQAARGEQLFAEFVAARAARSTSRSATRMSATQLDDAAAPLREWVREQHGIAVAVKRDEDVAALSGLPTLGELDKEAGLDKSSEAMIGFLRMASVTAVLAPYGIDAAEIARGQKLRETWLSASKGVTVGRGARGAATGEHISARDAFASWLAKWWGIAKVDLLAKAPRSLAALGVETAARRSTPRSPKSAGKAREAPK